VGVERDYGELVRRLRALDWPYLRLMEAGSIHGYPVFHGTLSNGAATRRRLLLSSGTHGDEPAGPHAVLKFLERNNTRLLEHLDLCVIPCLNPCGYVRGTRENGDGMDINRSFEDDSTAEAVLVKELLRGQRFDLLVEFHEDWEVEGYYLYEFRRRGPVLGPTAVARVAQIGPIHSGSSVDGYPAKNGVISPTPRVIARQEIGQKALPLYVLEHHADHIATSETPSQWQMPTRVRAHLAVLDVMLEHYSQL